MSTGETANDLKEQGNEAFAAKKFEEAEGFYSQAIAILGEDAPHTLFGNRAAARLGLGKPEEALEDAEVAINKDSSWLKGYHRKACAHYAMGEPEMALATYRHALELDSHNKWLEDQVRQAKAQVVSHSKTERIQSLDAWVTVFESMIDSRERLSTLAHLWNQCEAQDRHQIFIQFLALIAGAGASHTGVKPENFTEEMMVSLPMDNYEDLKPVETWMAFFRGLSRAHKVEGFKRMWNATEDREKNVIINDLRHFFLEPLLSGGSTGADRDDENEDDAGLEDGANRTGGNAEVTSPDGSGDGDASGAGKNQKGENDSSSSSSTAQLVGRESSGPGA